MNLLLLFNLHLPLFLSVFNETKRKKAIKPCKPMLVCALFCTWFYWLLSLMTQVICKRYSLSLN